MDIESPVGLTVFVSLVIAAVWVLRPAKSKILVDTDILCLLDYDSWKSEEVIWAEMEEMHQTLIDRLKMRRSLEHLEAEGYVTSTLIKAWRDKTVLIRVYKRVWDDSSSPQWEKPPAILDLTPASTA